jgi:ABC-type phosphate transport system substrate-binding protein
MRIRFLGSWRVGIAPLVGACLLAMGASSAQAEFTPPYTTQCSGSEAAIIDSGLQREAAATQAFEFEEEDLTSPLSCAGRGSSVRVFSSGTPLTLETLGSVGGKRNGEFTFAGGEEPPTVAQWLNIDLGNEPGMNSGLIRQIPIAATSVVPLVNFPAGCSIPSGEATSDGRFTVSNAALEAAYAGAIAKWGELLPGMEPACASLPIKRVVPGGSEGTTFVFKQWLAKVDPSRGWASLANTAWPKDSGATATVRAEEGDPAEAELLILTNGAIGFASLPVARNYEFGEFAPSNPHHKADRFWLSVINGAGERVEPTRDPNSGADNALGANCDNPTFNYVPSGYDSTVTPIWRVVSAAGSKTGWPICTLAYVQAWDDASTVYGNTAAEQAKQRTVKDYLAYVLGAAGQQNIEQGDYSKLSAALLADAQEGQSRVGWDKVPGSREALEKAVKSAIAAAQTHRSR